MTRAVIIEKIINIDKKHLITAFKRAIANLTKSSWIILEGNRIRLDYFVDGSYEFIINPNEIKFNDYDNKRDIYNFEITENEFVALHNFASVKKNFLENELEKKEFKSASDSVLRKIINS